MHHLMVLWVTTVIPPSLLQTNCPAKPHSYRQLCSGSGSEVSPNNSWGIFLSSIHSSGLGGEPGTINSSWHKLPGEGGMFIYTPTPNLWIFWKHLSGHWHQKRRIHLAQVQPPLWGFPARHVQVTNWKYFTCRERILLLGRICNCGIAKEVLEAWVSLIM